MTDYVKKLEEWHSDVQAKARRLGTVVRDAASAARRGGAISSEQQKVIEECRASLLSALQAVPPLAPEPPFNNGRPFTVDTLAERWKVSPHLIRSFIKTNKLPHWRLGDKLIRIKPETVLAVERGEIVLD